MTVYDGSGAADPAYVGPTYAQSPVLRGADNRQFAGTYHNDLRMSPAIIAVYRAFLQQAEGPYLSQPGTSDAESGRSQESPWLHRAAKASSSAPGSYHPCLSAWGAAQEARAARGLALIATTNSRGSVARLLGRRGIRTSRAPRPPGGWMPNR